MKNFFNTNVRYVKLVLAIVVSYIFIKLIDNLPTIFNIFDSAFTILSPFIFAFIIAYILNPIVNLINKKTKLSRSICIALTYVLFITIVGLAMTFIVPKLYSNIVQIINDMPTITSNIQSFVNESMAKLQSSFSIDPTMITSDGSKIITTVSSLVLELSNLLLSSALSLTSSIINVILGFLISIYVLVDKDKMLSFCRRFTRIVFGRNIGDGIIEFVETLHYMVGSYIGIKAIDSLIIACMAFFGLTFVGSEYTILLTVIVGVTNMIPYFGPFVGMAIGGFINLFFSPTKALIVFLFLFCLQQFDGWYLDPKLIGNRVGLRPFLVILAVTVGGALYGPIGMLLGSSVMAVIKIYTLKVMDKLNYRATEIN